MRLLPVLFVGLLLIAQIPATSAAFGVGAPAFVQVDAPAGLPNVENAGEPTIGINWETNSVFFQAYSSTYKVDRLKDGTLTWVDAKSPVPIINADPMLHTDPVTGRTWAGGLATACSMMSYTDDDGATWDPSGNMCGIYGVDHQTIGSGPWAGDAPDTASYDRAVYYCAHGEAISGAATGLIFSAASPTACLTSQDGGVTWGAPIPWVGGCGSLHGHVRVSPITGFAVVPDADCADGPGSQTMLAGYAYSADNGLTWSSATIPGSVARPGFDNPSAAFGHDEGWMWYGQASTAGVNIALSKDDGSTWEKLPERDGTTSTWVDVGAFHDPPIVWGTFADVVVGDDDRVAFSFLGLEDTDGDGLGEEFIPRNTCDAPEGEENRFWHYYVATSYDAGTTWTVTKVTKDPVQVGGIFQGQETTPNCRNLLDFNDMDINSKGRIYIGFADGCVGECAAKGEPINRSSTQRAAMIVQTAGPGLFSEFDVVIPAGANDDIDGDGIPNSEDDDIDGDGILNEDDPDPTNTQTEKASFGGTILVMAAIGSLAVLRRRTQ